MSGKVVVVKGFQTLIGRIETIRHNKAIQLDTDFKPL